MNPIENFLRSRRQRDQQIDPADQARPSVEVPPTPPQAQPMQPQPLPQIPSGHAVVRGILTELNMLSPIERAIIADALGFEEPLKSISPEDWVKLIEERVGEDYANAFRKWLGMKLNGGSR